MFENTVDINEVHIAGDFNLDSLSGRWMETSYFLNSLAKMIIEFCNMNNISQLVDTITRTQFDSVNKVTRKSCIDHVYCNYKHRLSSIRVVTCGASDHDAIVYTRYSKTPKLPTRTIRKRSYKHFNKEKYIEEMSKTDFSGVYSSKNVQVVEKWPSSNASFQYY